MEQLEKIKKLFNTKKSGDTHCFSLACWTDGMWSIVITDSWQNWIDKKVPGVNYKYETPEKACEAFIKHLKRNNIDVKELQEQEGV